MQFAAFCQSQERLTELCFALLLTVFQSYHGDNHLRKPRILTPVCSLRTLLVSLAFEDGRQLTLFILWLVSPVTGALNGLAQGDFNKKQPRGSNAART